LRSQPDMVFEPVPFIKTRGGGGARIRHGVQQLAVALTPITNTDSVLSSRVKLETDNHEARSDKTFTHSEDESDGEEAGKALASGMTAQSNGPDECVQAGDMPI
jgi:hypothetical protein